MTTKCENCPLREFAAFEDMTDSEAKYMDRFKVGEMSVQNGSELLAEGANATQLYTVLEGMGVRYKTLKDGKRQVIGFILPGDFVGLQAAVMDTMQHSVMASSPMKLCIFNRSNLWDLFKNHPDRAYDLVHVAAVEEYMLCEALTAVGQLDGMSSVSWALLRFFERLTALNLNRNNQVPLPYKQQDLADALGLSLVHTNKMLAALRKDGIASWSDGRLSVHDVDALRNRAHMDPVPLLPRPLI